MAGIGVERRRNCAQACKRLLSARPALGFAGGAADADTLADYVAGSMPDVVVTDMEPDGSDALNGIRARHAPSGARLVNRHGAIALGDRRGRQAIELPLLL